MTKKLPNLYINKITKPINNNKTFYYTAHKEKEIIKDNPINLRDKIGKLFNSPNFVYKINVNITLKDEKIINKDIVGEVNGKLITLDEELIEIDNIIDIEY